MAEQRLATPDDVGKTILVGITHLDKDGKAVQQTQHYGTVLRVGQGLIDVELTTGSFTRFPPMVKDAAPGTYRLRSTGEEVVNPDLLATWTYNKGS